jgi:hypothetical protein
VEGRSGCSLDGRDAALSEEAVFLFLSDARRGLPGIILEAHAERRKVMKLLPRHEEPEILLLPAFDVGRAMREAVDRITLGIKGWATAMDQVSASIAAAGKVMGAYGDAARHVYFEHRIFRARRLAAKLFGGLFK